MLFRGCICNVINAVRFLLLIFLQIKFTYTWRPQSDPATTTYRHYEVCAIFYHVTSQLTLRAASLVCALTTLTSSTLGWPKQISTSYREFKTVQHVSFVTCRVDSNIQPTYCVSYTGCQCAVESTSNWLCSVTKRTASAAILPCRSSVVLRSTGLDLLSTQASSTTIGASEVFVCSTGHMQHSSFR